MIGLIYIMLRETLRMMIIDGFLTGAYGFHVMATTPKFMLFLTIVAMVITAAHRFRSPVATVACSASIAALAVFVLKPGLGVLFAPVMATLAHLDTPERYVEPYSWKPLFIIYATFIEAVVATFLIAALTWPRWGHETRFDLASSWRSSWR